MLPLSLLEARQAAHEENSPRARRWLATVEALIAAARKAEKRSRALAYAQGALRRENRALLDRIEEMERRAPDQADRIVELEQALSAARRWAVDRVSTVRLIDAILLRCASEGVEAVAEDWALMHRRRSAIARREKSEDDALRAAIARAPTDLDYPAFRRRGRWKDRARKRAAIE